MFMLAHDEAVEYLMLYRKNIKEYLETTNFFGEMEEKAA
jgi:hypothetical protein